MMKVRRMLTEVLLEVTTEEMQSVAEETLSRARSKGIAKIQQAHSSNSLFLLPALNICVLAYKIDLRQFSEFSQEQRPVKLFPSSKTACQCFCFLFGKVIFFFGEKCF